MADKDQASAGTQAPRGAIVPGANVAPIPQPLGSQQYDWHIGNAVPAKQAVAKKQATPAKSPTPTKTAAPKQQHTHNTKRHPAQTVHHTGSFEQSLAILKTIVTNAINTSIREAKALSEKQTTRRVPAPQNKPSPQRPPTEAEIVIKNYLDGYNKIAPVQAYGVTPTGMINEPNHVPYGIKFYVDRAKDFEARMGRPAPDYYLGYGNKYIHRFTEKTLPTLSPQGQVWLRKATQLLQQAMEKNLEKLKIEELNNERFTNFAFDTHVHAYEQAGLISLPAMDKIKILLTPDASDLFSDRGLKQAAKIATDLSGYYTLHPEFAGQQIVELEHHREEIAKMVHNYYVENKKFFDDAAKVNPNVWADPEHRIIKTIRRLLLLNLPL